MSDNKIMVCVNDSLHSEVALKYAIKKSQDQSAQLIILHVVEVPEGEMLIVNNNTKSELYDKAEEFLDRLVEKSASLFKDLPEILIKEGNLADAIIKQTQENSDIQLVVIGAGEEPTPTRGNLTKLVLQVGSKLITPVIFIPGSLTDQQIQEL